MIVVTHEMEFARHVSDKVVFMADGLVEASGTPGQIIEKTQNARRCAFPQAAQTALKCCALPDIFKWGGCGRSAFYKAGRLFFLHG